MNIYGWLFSILIPFSGINVNTKLMPFTFTLTFPRKIKNCISFVNKSTTKATSSHHNTLIYVCTRNKREPGKGRNRQSRTKNFYFLSVFVFGRRIKSWANERSEGKNSNSGSGFKEEIIIRALLLAALAVVEYFLMGISSICCTFISPFAIKHAQTVETRPKH